MPHADEQGAWSEEQGVSEASALPAPCSPLIAEDGCLTRLRVASVHVRFYQIVDGCKVPVFGQAVLLPQRSPREEGNRQGRQERQGSLNFNSNVPTARLADSGKELAAMLFFSVFPGGPGGSSLPFH